MKSSLPDWLKLSSEVRAGMDNQAPIVALESTVITHGLPRPINLETARQVEDDIRKRGAVPATIAVVRGELRLGLAPDELEALALDQTTQKLNRRDLSIATVRGTSGGTTVSATMFVAQAAGIKLFATGGIGGVHRGSLGDVSADLTELAQTPVAVVCAGAKAILDLPRTLEWLETAGVPVVGWKTDEFPAFYSRTSSLPTSARVDTTAQAAELAAAHWALGLGSGILFCVPCPQEAALPESVMQEAIVEADKQAVKEGISGKAVTPFLLSKLVEHTGGASLTANVALLRENAIVAAGVAASLAST
jgi:pseudouridine-5'-phosphate glycosidase